MAKNLQIKLEFTTGGSAKKLIEKLEMLSAAQRKLARNQREFNNANLKAVKAFKTLIMAQEKHRSAMLKSSTQIAKLKEQIRVLRMRNQQLAASMKKTTRATNRMRISTAGLQRIIGSIRNKILLVTFAFGSLAAGIRSSVQTSMQFEAVQVRLNAMFGSVKDGERAFRTFNQIAATTPFTLTDVVEAGAALKAFGTNAEEMIKPTADLAAFMGTTATEAAAALGRAFAGGAGAADILRERGILQLIRDTKGIEDLSKLTLPQFRKALEETLLDPNVGIAGATDALSKTLTGMVSNMADAFTRMKAAIGDFIDMKGIVSTLTSAFQTMGESIKQASETPFETSIRHLQDMNIETTELELSQANYLKLKMDEKGVLTDIEQAQKNVTDRTNDVKEIQLELADLRKKMVDDGFTQAEAEKLVNMTYAEQLKALVEMFRLDGMSGVQAFAKARVQRDILNSSLEEIHAKENELAVAQELVAAGLLTQEQAIEYAALIAKIAGLEQQILDKQKEQNEETDKAIEKRKKLFDFTQEEKDDMSARVELFQDHFGQILSLQKQNLRQRVDNELKALRRTDKFRNASMEQRQSMEDDVRAKFSKEQQRIFDFQKKMSILKIIVDTITARNKLIADGLAASIFNPAAGIRAKLTMAALMASSAAQIALVNQQQAPAFARGGSFVTDKEQLIRVGDNAGGRERVDITPISTPDFGDAGGGTGVTVNIMGNVIGTQEFVRDNLLPEIENSIKRNLA